MQRLDLPKIWKLAKRNAADSLGEYGITLPPLPEDCPLTLDELLDPGFSPRGAAATIAALQTPATRRPAKARTSDASIAGRLLVIRSSAFYG